MLSVNDTIWRTNNVLEVSHQHLHMHMMGNRNHPEPWIFLSKNNDLLLNLINYLKYYVFTYIII